MNEIEYYIIDRENNNSYPLLLENQGSPVYTTERNYIEDTLEMQFCMGDPIPKKPRIVDYHSTPYSVISRKIYDVLEPMKIRGLQLIPATIIGINNELIKDYWYVHIYNNYPVLDRENSIYRWSEIRQVANFIEKLVLDTQKLKEIPMENRLVFRLQERRTFQLFHQSIVDAILSVNPEGVRFINVKDWTL